MAPRKTIEISTPTALGRLIKLARQKQKLRQDEVGRLSHTFIGEIEAGKPTAQIGKAFTALHELGLKLHVELPADIDPAEVREVQAGPA